MHNSPTKSLSPRHQIDLIGKYLIGLLLFMGMVGLPVYIKFVRISLIVFFTFFALFRAFKPSNLKFPCLKRKKNNVQFLKIEKEKQIYTETQLEAFSKKVNQHRQKLMNLLYDIKKNGKTIVGISAPAKGNTLLNFCKIDKNFLDFITEKSSLKISKYTPGTHIQVLSDERLIEDKPDYALILAWNFATEIMENNNEFKNQGGKFIIPIPYPKII